MGKIIILINALEDALLQSIDLGNNYEGYVREHRAEFRGNVDDSQISILMSELIAICHIFDTSKTLFERNRDDASNRKEYSIRKGRLLDKLEEIRHYALLNHLT